MSALEELQRKLAGIQRSGHPTRAVARPQQDVYAEIRRKLELLNQPQRPITLEDFPEFKPREFVSSINRDPVMPVGGMGGPDLGYTPNDPIGTNLTPSQKEETIREIVGNAKKLRPTAETVSPQFAPDALPSMAPVQRQDPIQEKTFLDEPPPTVLSERPAITQPTTREPYEGNAWERDPNIERAFMGAKDEQGRQTHRGMLEGLLGGVRSITNPIFSGAKNLFEDPQRMALLMAGLKMMDPNSQYTVDKAGNEWYSPWSAPVSGLGAGIQTYKTLSEPRKIGFEAQEDIKRKNALELETQKQTGRMSLEAEKNRITGGKTAKDKNGRLRFISSGKLVYPDLKVDPESMDFNQVFNAELKISGAFDKETKLPRAQVDAYRRIEAIFEDPMMDNPVGSNSMVEDEQGTVQLRGFKTADGKFFELDQGGAADLALIFNFMKMLDPQSVVRESEFALAETTGGMSETIKAQWQKLLEGGRLSTQMRRNIMRQARSQYNSAEREMKKQYKEYTKRAEKYSDMGLKSERALYYEPYDPMIPIEAFNKPVHPVTNKPIDPKDPLGIKKR